MESGLKVRFFDYPLQFKAHEEEYLGIIKDTFSRGAFILGAELERFEEGLAGFTGARFAVGVGNCTDALLLSLHAAGIGPGDEVISVSHTFAATIEVIKFLGARPVLIDIAEDHNMDVNLVEAAVTGKTKAIVPVHLNGAITKGMDRLRDIAERHNLKIIEDAAQSLGATFRGKGAGTFGLAGCFSFYPAKLLGAFGDAGAIITDDAELAKKLKMLRNHGRAEGAYINQWGLNCRMDNIHAAILECKLKKLPLWIKRRRQIAGLYHAGLSGIDGLKLPAHPDKDRDYFDVFQNYEVEAHDRDNLIGHLREKGIQTSLPWGGHAVHQFKGLGLSFSLKRTEGLFKNALMLPLYPELNDEQINHVIESIQGFYGTIKTPA